MKRIVVCAMWLTAACSGEQRAGPATGAPAAEPMSVIDSVRPIEVELERFRAALRRQAPTELEHAEGSRDGLVQAFVRALESQDTARLAELTLNAAEFAYFYYPFTVYTHPPYTQAPAMVWLLTTQNGEKGLTRLLQRFGPGEFDYRGYRCARTEPQDVNRLHVNCGVLIGGDTVPRRLFGTIIERGGRFKFVSYANGL